MRAQCGEVVDCRLKRSRIAIMQPLRWVDGRPTPMLGMILPKVAEGLEMAE